MVSPPKSLLLKFSILLLCLSSFLVWALLLFPFSLSFFLPPPWGFWSSCSLLDFVELASIVVEFSYHCHSCDRKSVCWKISWQVSSI